MAVIHYKAGDISIPEARALVTEREDGGLRFDYVHGRPMKVELDGDSFDPDLFDRDNGEGAAARAIQALRK